MEFFVVCYVYFCVFKNLTDEYFLCTYIGECVLCCFGFCWDCVCVLLCLQFGVNCGHFLVCFKDLDKKIETSTKH